MAHYTISKEMLDQEMTAAWSEFWTIRSESEAFRALPESLRALLADVAKDSFCVGYKAGQVTGVCHGAKLATAEIESDIKTMIGTEP